MMTNLFLKAKESIKKTLHYQEERAKKTQMTQKLKHSIPYFVSIILVFFYFSYEYIDENSNDFLKARSEYKTNIDSVTVALNEIKKQSLGTVAYSKYQKAVFRKNQSKLSFKKAKDQQTVFQFKSMKFFLYELGPNLCWFSFLIFITFRSFYFERDNIGVKVLYTVMISLSIFKFFWIFQQFQDFSKITYYAMTLVSAAVVVLAVYLITKYQDHYINRLKEKVSRLAAFSFLHTKQEKKSEMLNLFRELSKDP